MRIYSFMRRDRYISGSRGAHASRSLRSDRTSQPTSARCRCKTLGLCLGAMFKLVEPIVDHLVLVKHRQRLHIERFMSRPSRPTRHVDRQNTTLQVPRITKCATSASISRASAWTGEPDSSRPCSCWLTGAIAVGRTGMMPSCCRR